MVRVKRAKLIIIPRVMPNGFLRAFVTDEERMIGSNGQIHGAKMVTNPDKKAKNNKINILIF